MKMKIGRASTYELSPSDLKPGRELRGHTNRSGTTIHGMASAGFGMIFVVAGITVGVLGWQEKLNAQPAVPTWLAPIFGLIFALGGLSFVLHGVQRSMRQRRTGQLREHHGHEPWVWDHPWDETGSPDDSPRRIRQMTWFTAFLALFLIPFNWISWNSSSAMATDCIRAAASTAASPGRSPGLASTPSGVPSSRGRSFWRRCTPRRA